MKRLIKIVIYLIILIILFAGIAIIYVSMFLPNVKVDQDLKVEITPESLERGKYLATSVMGCMACHAERDKSLFTMPVNNQTKGLGGTLWSKTQGFPGEMYSLNITPYRLQEWTDGEVFRAITAGVSRDGSALFPIMPYHLYGRLPKEDIYNVIAYLRTLDPVRKEHPPRKLDFPLSLLVHLMPKKGDHDLGPSPDPINHGEYLITAAACYDCHTPVKDGQYIEDMAFAGGFEFQLETGGMVRSSNITPDMDTGIGNWSKEAFIAKFKSYQEGMFVPHKIKPGNFNTEMPWTSYSNMKEEELGSIYDYLMSLEPINHRVEKFTGP